VKDIYSPLDIDEEWDNMAPMADAPAMPAMSTEGATAVAVKPAEQSPMEGGMDTMSTLPPADSTNELKDPAESAAMDVSTMGAPTAEAPIMSTSNGDEKAAGTLELNDINPSASSETTDASMAMPESKDEMANNSLGADTEKAAATPIPVIDMNEASKEMSDTNNTSVNVGESFTPEEKPAEDRFAGMKAEQVEPEKTDTNAEMKDDSSTKTEAPAAAELPVTPADNKVSKFDDKDKMKFDMSEANEAMDSFEKESDTQDNKFIKMLEEARDRALEGIGHEIDAAQNKLSDLNGQLDKIGTKRDEAQSNLDRLMDEKSRIESSL
jgi:hypothetical protein